jgi:hypothetical protein
MVAVAFLLKKKSGATGHLKPTRKSSSESAGGGGGGGGRLCLSAIKFF